MSDQDISTQCNPDLKTYVLEGQTVNSLLQDFVERSSQTIEEAQLSMLKEQVNTLTTFVASVSPSDVEENKLETLIDKVNLLIPIFENKQNAIDDFFNTLNLCVVGLGSKLRGNLS